MNLTDIETQTNIIRNDFTGDYVGILVSTTGYLLPIFITLSILFFVVFVFLELLQMFKKIFILLILFFAFTNLVHAQNDYSSSYQITSYSGTVRISTKLGTPDITRLDEIHLLYDLNGATSTPDAYIYRHFLNYYASNGTPFSPCTIKRLLIFKVIH